MKGAWSRSRSVSRPYAALLARMVSTFSDSPSSPPVKLFATIVGSPAPLGGQVCRARSVLVLCGSTGLHGLDLLTPSPPFNSELRRSVSCCIHFVEKVSFGSGASLSVSRSQTSWWWWGPLGSRDRVVARLCSLLCSLTFLRYFRCGDCRYSRFADRYSPRSPSEQQQQ